MDNTEIQFSLAIPLFNKANSIASTLDYVYRQMWSQFEVVVDDGSSDGGQDIVVNYLIKESGFSNYRMLAYLRPELQA